MSVISQLQAPEHRRVATSRASTRGRFWFAMEYVDGTNLEAVASDARPAATRSTRPAGWPARSSRGSTTPTRLGFVHRDIKPENILIGRNADGLLVAKISDFGLAKSYRGIGLSGLTFSGEMRGTIPFMPPEQMLDFKTVTPSGRPLRHRRHPLLPAHRPVHLRRRGRGGDLDPLAAGGAPRCRSDADGRTSPPRWPRSSTAASPATPPTATPTPRPSASALRPFC